MDQNSNDVVVVATTWGIVPLAAGDEGKDEGEGEGGKDGAGEEAKAEVEVEVELLE